MLHIAIQYIFIIVLALLLIMLAQRIRIAYPIVLVIAGLILGFAPFFPEVRINPELVFIIFLPPLLYDAAWYTSWKEFWRWRRVIGTFAFLIVIVTATVVAWVASLVLPNFTLAMGFLLGAVVSPPDAVSAAAILKYVKVPRRLISMLEGESLLNDASSLIVFRFALIAVSTGHFVMKDAALSFIWVITAGVAIGLAIGYLFYLLHKKLPTDVNTDIILTLVTPYVMYITAEVLHVSGVLAVVSGGLFLSAKEHLFLNYRSRLKSASVWSAAGFVLNGLIFMLIGLQLPLIVSRLDGVTLPMAIGYGCLFTALLMVIRVLCTLGASAFTVFISQFITTADSRPGWRAPFIFGWAGMRGVVSLAAAMSIPAYVDRHAPFPRRDLILFITFVVIFLTLVVQGLTLPAIIKAVNLKDPDNYLPDGEQEALLSKKLAERSRRYLEATYEGDGNAAFDLLKATWKQGLEMNFNAKLRADYRNARLQLIEQQRTWLHEWNHKLEIDETLIRKYLSLLDMEEEQLTLKYREG
jgi:monovalent cation/hydrogen antiporter